MTANGDHRLRELLERELARLAALYHEQFARLQLGFKPSEIRKQRDTWIVPVELGEGSGTSDEVIDLIRQIRSSLEAKTSGPVSVLIDPDLD
jgi:hypothetical protein